MLLGKICSIPNYHMHRYLVSSIISKTQSMKSIFIVQFSILDCPAFFCNAQKELVWQHLKSGEYYAIQKNESMVDLIFKIQLTEFIVEHREKLSSFQNQSIYISCPKLYANPNLRPEDKSHQINTLWTFECVKVPWKWE